MVEALFLYKFLERYTWQEDLRGNFIDLNEVNAVALTPKRKRFVDEYLLDLNAMRAYRAAYPRCQSNNSAAVRGHRLLQDQDVLLYLQERQADLRRRVEIKQEDVIAQLAAVAFADAADYSRVELTQAVDPVTGTPKTDADGKPVMVEVVRHTPTADLTANQRKAIACIKEGRYGIEVQLADKIKALELLGRHLGLFSGEAGNDNATQEAQHNALVGAIDKAVQDADR